MFLSKKPKICFHPLSAAILAVISFLIGSTPATGTGRLSASSPWLHRSTNPATYALDEPQHAWLTLSDAGKDAPSGEREEEDECLSSSLTCSAPLNYAPLNTATRRSAPQTAMACSHGASR